MPETIDRDTLEFAFNLLLDTLGTYEVPSFEMLVDAIEVANDCRVSDG